MAQNKEAELKSGTVVVAFLVIGAATLFYPVVGGFAATNIPVGDNSHTLSSQTPATNDPNETILKFEKFLSLIRGHRRSVSSPLGQVCQHYTHGPHGLAPPSLGDRHGCLA
jgi:hypothetical protein